MKIQDDRLSIQKETHKFAIVGTDTFMSGWGEAEGERSYAAWAFPEGYETEVREKVEARNEMKRIRLVRLDKYHPKGQGHLHIYVYNPTIMWDKVLKTTI